MGYVGPLRGTDLPAFDNAITVNYRVVFYARIRAEHLCRPTSYMLTAVRYLLLVLPSPVPSSPLNTCGDPTAEIDERRPHVFRAGLKEEDSTGSYVNRQPSNRPHVKDFIIVLLYLSFCLITQSSRLVTLILQSTVCTSLLIYRMFRA
jgi:hypothetical protein